METKDYLQWECRGGKAGWSHDPAVFVLTARTATQVSPKTHLLAMQAALQRSGPATRAAFSQGCIIDAETIYKSLNGN